jgi:uncharacterized protein (TIGR03000 family)
MRVFFHLAAAMLFAALILPSTAVGDVPLDKLTQALIRDYADKYLASYRLQIAKIGDAVGEPIILRGDQIEYQKNPDHTPKSLVWKYETEKPLREDQQAKVKIELSRLMEEILGQYTPGGGVNLVGTKELQQFRKVFSAVREPMKKPDPPVPPVPPTPSPSRPIIFVVYGWSYDPCMNSWMLVGSFATVQMPAPQQITHVRSKVRIDVPEGGKLFVNGRHIDVAPGRRVFETPPLAAGQLYFYTMRIEAEQDGQSHSESQQVIVRGGEDAYVNFPTLVAKSKSSTRKELTQKHQEEFRDDYPKDAPECFSRGCIAFKERNYSVARAYFNEAVRLNENDARFYYFKAFSEFAMDNKELALTSVRRAQELRDRGLPATEQIDFALRNLPESVHDFLASVPAPKAKPSGATAQR